MLLTDLEGKDHFKIFAMGDSGTGKTVFAATFPGPIKFFDFDRKISSAKKYLEVVCPEKMALIDFEQYSESKKQDETNHQNRVNSFKSFESDLDALEEAALTGKFEFKSVVLDSATTFYHILMSHVIQEHPGLKRPADFVPCQTDYLIASGQFKQVLLRLLALPCHFLMTGHIKEDKDQETGRMLFRPSVSGQLTTIIPILFEEVYRTFKATNEENKKVFLAQTSGDERYALRTQIPGIEEVIPLNFKAILSASQKAKELRKKMEKKSKARQTNNQATA